jgi:hypothetical protein
MMLNRGAHTTRGRRLTNPTRASQAEARLLPQAARSCRAALAASEGTSGPAWALLALVMSALRRASAAHAAVEAGLAAAGPDWEWLLVKIKARAVLF